MYIIMNRLCVWFEIFKLFLYELIYKGIEYVCFLSF